MSHLEALAGALLHATWQLGALALAFVCARAVLSTARHRYAAAMCTLALQVAAPAVTWAERVSRPAVEGAVSSAPAAEPAWAWWVVTGWGFGAALVALRLVGGVVTVRRWVREALPVPAAFEARLAALAVSWNVRRVRFVASTRHAVPMVTGVLRPVVFLPLSLFSALPVASLELLVAHELAHVRRWDYLANLLQRVAEALLFFHPAVWWVSSVARDERELCCDDLVARRTGDPVAYAEALLALEEHRHTTASLALASHGGQFMKRIERLIDTSPRRSQPLLGLTLVAVVFALVGVTLVSGPARAEGRASNISWLPPVLAPLRGELEQAAARNGIEPDLLALFVLVESQGDAHAVSPSGARGLMQLMPKTAERVAAEARVAYAPERLDEPGYNLELGARYLAAQLNQFQGNPRQVEFAAAAYNGGPKAAQAWIEGRGALSAETDRYRALVAGLWSERKDASSATWQQWRSAVRERSASRAVAPVVAAKASLPWGAQTDPFTGQPYQHRGVDLPAALGTAVVAPLDGVVTEISSDPAKGTVLVLRHRGGIESRFHHLGAVKVSVDQTVTQGSPVAEVGVTGKTTGPHVHFEVRDLGEAIDPTPFLR